MPSGSLTHWSDGGGDEKTPLIGRGTVAGGADTLHTHTARAWTPLRYGAAVVVAAVSACVVVVAAATAHTALTGDFLHKKYILLSLGRSGSTTTFAAIDSLTHGQMRPLDKTMLYEILGSSSHAMNKRTDPDAKTRKFFEKKFREHPSTPTAGFKWKPLVDNENYDRAWKWCVANDVRLIIMTRNPLDMVISQTKHHDHPSLNPHCHGDHCVQDHAVKVELPTGDELSKKMGELQKHYDMVRKKCEEMKANCHETSYEKLFATDPAKQLAAWRDVVRFVQDKYHADEVSVGRLTLALT